MSGSGTAMGMKQKDILMGVIFLIFAISFYVLSYHFFGFEFEKIPNDVGAAFLPRLLLIILALESVFLVFFSLRRREETAPKSVKVGWRGRPVIMFGAFLVYIYLATLLGYIISTMSFLILSFYLLGVHKIWLLIVVPIVLTFSTYYLFGSLLNVYLPSGNLF